MWTGQEPKHVVLKEIHGWKIVPMSVEKTSSICWAFVSWTNKQTDKGNSKTIKQANKWDVVQFYEHLFRAHPLNSNSGVILPSTVIGWAEFSFHNQQ